MAFSFCAGGSEESEAALQATEGAASSQVAFQPVSGVLLQNPRLSSVAPSVSTVLRAVVAFAGYRKWSYAQVCRNVC